MSTSNSIINQAKEVINEISKSGSSDLGNYAETIQNILNGVFQNNGIITADQKNKLDEQIRLAKIKLLEEESKKTMIRIGVVSGSIILGFGFLWYITRDKFKK